MRELLLAALVAFLIYLSMDSLAQSMFAAHYAYLDAKNSKAYSLLMEGK